MCAHFCGVQTSVGRHIYREPLVLCSPPLSAADAACKVAGVTDATPDAWDFYPLNLYPQVLLEVLDYLYVVIETQAPTLHMDTGLSPTNRNWCSPSLLQCRFEIPSSNVLVIQYSASYSYYQKVPRPPSLHRTICLVFVPSRPQVSCKQSQHAAAAHACC